ncbi:MAG TPA: metal ABC transporter permease [Fibrobacteres bacterium]|nr:metal ABC transporter permease [Fibrobacterota bacterium]
MSMLLFHYPFMFPALVICMILAGIHTYFGYHIVRRGVIFVDLSLSQIAAFGASVALIFGWGDEAPVKAFWVSLGFTFGGAVLFAFLRRSQKIVPMEALIGIIYAGAMALSLLVLEKTATGTEHIKEMLVGTILTVSWHDVLQLGSVVLAVGIIHALSYKRLFLVSENPEEAAAKHVRMWLWDIVFYATFGIVVTLSVKVAGVLLIFSLLTIPAVTSVICSKGTISRLVLGWMFGLAGCLLGLELSLRMDTAAGPSIITTLLGIMLICAVVVFILKKNRTKPGKN